LEYLSLYLSSESLKNFAIVVALKSVNFGDLIAFAFESFNLQFLATSRFGSEFWHLY
jgi:hypothetical protein